MANNWASIDGESSSNELKVSMPSGGGPYAGEHDPPPSAARNGSSGVGVYGRHGQLCQKDEFVKVCLLGAPGVGKTAIAQQFALKTFTSSYFPTSKKETYYPTVVFHGRTYSLRLVDIPDIPFLPLNSYYNISDLQAYGLRDANAYVLIYDLLNPDSFEYISSMFNQISTRDLSRVPVVVVGNKTDKVNCSSGREDRYDYSSSKYRTSGGSLSSRYADEHDGFSTHDHHHHDGGDYHDSFRSSLSHHHHSSSHHSSSHRYDKDKHSRDRYGDRHRHYGSSHSSSSYRNGHPSHSSSRHYSSTSHKKIFYYEEDNFLEREIADKVQNEWKAMYKESSAQDHASIERIFKALMEVVEERGLDDGSDDGSPKKCVIL